MYSDTFGLLLPNNKLIADAYAKSGEYLVYLPDFFKGDPVPLKVADVMIPVDAVKQGTLGKYTGMLAILPTFLSWKGRHKHEPTHQICVEFLQNLRCNTPRGQKIGIVGFCWGGRYAVRAGMASNAIEIDGEIVPLVDAVVALHPSNMVVPMDVEALAVPTSFGWGTEDAVTSIGEMAKVEQTHAKVAAAGGKLPTIEHKSYTPGRHGFGVRGNPEDPAEKSCLEGTEKQVLDWFQRWL
jgi:dienelactone hydrolase